ncbi:MAG: cytochrome b/b6 domain-containing protein [Gammaproteobacteria bacterium]|nr:cytochrome b/b6 domain-containing protein [Gammaproteobacteria bacterium]
MNNNEIQRISVWSRALRITHWVMAAAVVMLIATGWRMAGDLLPASTLQDDHFLAAAFLIPAFLLRIYLLFFGTGTDHISDCEPDMNRLRSAVAVLKYYFSLGRSPLPNWYAHNPLWGPLYLLLFLFFLIQILSGTLQQSHPYIGMVNLHDVHIIGAYVITGFSVVHLLAVFLHDLGGSGSDISAMINGHRIFILKKPVATQQSGEVQSVSLDELRRSLKNKMQDNNRP